MSLISIGFCGNDGFTSNNKSHYVSYQNLLQSIISISIAQMPGLASKSLTLVSVKLRARQEPRLCNAYYLSITILSLRRKNENRSTMQTKY